MKRYDKILVPVDGSKLSQSAFDQAISLAKLVEAEVTVMHVLEPIPFVYHDIYSEETPAISGSIISSENQDKVKLMLEKFAKRGNEKGVTVVALIKKGNPADQIIKESSDHDLIIIGSMGHSALDHLFLGSTAERVSRQACCPVMLVRDIGRKCRK